MKSSAYCQSKKGIKSDENQDSAICSDELGLFILCDGMGGHKGGKTASQLSVRTIESFVRERLKEPSKRTSSSGRVAIRIVESAIQAACQAVFRESQKKPECRGMGTTLSMVLLYGTTAIIGHVGDSRVYLLRKGKLSQLSRDHTIVQEMLDQGLISARQAENNPYAHVLSRAVGAAESVIADVFQIDLLHSDRLLLFSDGVCDVLDDPDIKNLSVSADPQACTALFINAASKKGSADDMTAMVIDFSSPNPQSVREKARSETVTLTLDILQEMYLFKELLLDELMRVVERCSVKICKPGEQIIQADSPGNSLYLILKGRFEVRSKRRVLTILTEKNHIGEMALLSGEPRSADVVAISDGQLLRLDRKEFQALLAQEPKIGVKLLSSMAKELGNRLRAMNATDNPGYSDLN